MAVYTSPAIFLVWFFLANTTGTWNCCAAKQFLNPGDRVLIIDDFLAKGAALQGLIQLVRESGATLVGAGIAVEKAFQTGGDLIRGMGVRVESLARIKSMGAGGIEFC